MEYDVERGHYLVVGGAHDGASRSQLYIWDGSPASQPVLVKDVKFARDLNPEAISIFSGIDKVQIYSDDGALLQPDGSGGYCPCKELQSSENKKYRALWIDASALELEK